MSDLKEFWLARDVDDNTLALYLSEPQSNGRFFLPTDSTDNVFCIHDEHSPLKAIAPGECVRFVRADPPPKNTKKVRISVAMQANGEWNSCGYGYANEKDDPSDNTKMELALDPLGDDVATCIVTAHATLPPRVAEIEGTVSE